MRSDDLLDDVEAETEAVLARRLFTRAPLERVEDRREHVLRDRRPGVVDRESQREVVVRHGDADRTLRIAVMDRIGDQVDQHLAEALWIPLPEHDLVAE